MAGGRARERGAGRRAGRRGARLGRDAPAAPRRGVGARALALLDLGRGRHEAAFERLAALAGGPDAHPARRMLVVGDLVEAAVGCGRADEAAAPLRDLAAWTRSTGSAWGAPRGGRRGPAGAGRRRRGAAFAEAVAAHAAIALPFDRGRLELRSASCSAARAAGRRAAAPACGARHCSPRSVAALSGSGAPPRGAAGDGRESRAPARRRARSTSSRRRRGRSRGWSRRAPRPGGRRAACSSARARSTTTCARSSRKLGHHARTQLAGPRLVRGAGGVDR